MKVCGHFFPLTERCWKELGKNISETRKNLHDGTWIWKWSLRVIGTRKEIRRKCERVERKFGTNFKKGAKNLLGAGNGKWKILKMDLSQLLLRSSECSIFLFCYILKHSNSDPFGVQSIRSITFQKLSLPAVISEVSFQIISQVYPWVPKEFVQFYGGLSLNGWPFGQNLTDGAIKLWMILE